MSSLTEVEKRYLEALLGMQSGYVLDYSDNTFAQLFNRHKIHIHAPQYQIHGTSKAKKMRAFWEREPDALVGNVLSEMLDSYETECDLKNKEIDTKILKKSRDIVKRLTGQPASIMPPQTIDDFLHCEFTIPHIQKLPIEAQMIQIIENRLAEARTTLQNKAYLSTIFLCGSVLEGILLGAANTHAARFNAASASPKDKQGTVKRFHDWNLAQLIDVACEIGLLKPDVQKFGHGLRDFRNYIHPYQQMVSAFTPDEHTAKVCFQVLKAALVSVAGER
jgi:hypothetical protein